MGNVMLLPANLEELHLQGCTSLERLPESIKFVRRLEKLVLSHCPSLVEIPAELCEVYSLKYLDLSGCSGLHSLPDRLGNCKRLQYLDLSHCKKLESLPSTFGDFEKLEHLDLTSCSALNELPSPFHKLEQIRHLDMGLCDNLVTEVNLLVCFSKLEFLNTMFCQRFDIPAVTFQHCIRTLNISCAQFKVLPRYLRELENLEDLSLCQGYEVKTLDPFVFTKLYHLKNLSIVQFPVLEDLGSSLGSLNKLESLSIAQCGLLRLPEEIENLKSLENLQIHDCSNLFELPMGIKGLSSLTIFSLRGCSSLQLDPEAFPNISTVQEIFLANCYATYHFFQLVFQGGVCLREIELTDMRLPSLEGIAFGESYISSFSILFCSNIKSFEILKGVSSINIEDSPCLGVVIVPDHNTSLQMLHLGNCENLLEVRSIENLKHLKSLNISGCYNLHTVEGLDKVNRLSELQLFLSDWYLSREDLVDDWLKKTLSTEKVPRVTHLSAKVESENFQLDDLQFPFKQIPQHSPNKFMFKIPLQSSKSFCGVVICFGARRSLFSNTITRPKERKDRDYLSAKLCVVNDDLKETEICQYEITDPSNFFHVSIFMDEFLVSEMLSDGSQLELSTFKGEMIYGAWMFFIPANNRYLAGEVACSLIDNLKEHKRSVRK